jgi:predicted Na+-dependent transporter
MFNADLALSVTMTAFSTVLSMVMMPTNLLLYTRSYKADTLESLDLTALFTAIALVTVAVSTGMYCSARIHSRKFNKLANHLGNAAGVLLIIFSATVSNTGDADSKIWARHWTFYAATALPCILALLLATVISILLRLPRPEVVTVAIEVCYQNIGIASSLALTMFNGDELNDAMGVPFFYGICEMVLVGIYCIVCWKGSWTKAPADAPICTVVWTSYEVLEQELKEINQIEVDLSSSTEKSVETQEGNVLTTYFNLSWLDPSPELPVHSQPQKEEPKMSTSIKPASAYV